MDAIGKVIAITKVNFVITWTKKNKEIYLKDQLESTINDIINEKSIIF